MRLSYGIAARALRSLNGQQTLGNSRLFWSCWTIAVALLIALPLLVSRYQIITASDFIISAILALSLCLVWGYGGILNLGQAAFYCIGGYSYGVVAMNTIDSSGNTDLAIIAGIVVPALVAVLLGALMFYSRLKGVYVAILMLVTSLLLGLFMRQTADPHYTIGAAYLGGMNGLSPSTASDPSLPSINLGLGQSVFEFDGRGRAFYWLVLGAGIAVYLGLRWMINSSIGYVLVAIREDSDRTETLGYDARLVQLAVFCLSAAIAGFAGALYTAWGTYIHPDGFSVAANILVVIWVAVGGRKDLTAVIISTVALSWISIELTAWGDISLFALGCILVAAVMIAPEGIVIRIGLVLGRLLAPPACRKAATPAVNGAIGPAAPHPVYTLPPSTGAVIDPNGAPSVLEVRDVHKVFGGVRALNGLSLAVADGEIHCIIGPNGAGKSTLFKLLMGTDRPTTGHILHRGRDITALPTFRRTRLGLSVKFQNIRVFSDLTAYQNLFIPLRRHHRAQLIPDHAAALLDRIGLAGSEQRIVRELSHGQQQWLSIAMSMALQPEVLLLDEPTAGMSSEETRKTAAIIRDLNRSGATVVVIEHDMGFIRDLRARTSVLHYGRLFAQGSFDEIAADADVRRIYLGTL